MPSILLFCFFRSSNIFWVNCRRKEDNTLLGVFITPLYVYDFSVENNENFMLQSGIFVHNTLNTFHQAGSGNKVVTTGVPRVEELLNATKDQKCSNLTVYMKNPHKSIIKHVFI